MKQLRDWISPAEFNKIQNQRKRRKRIRQGGVLFKAIRKIKKIKDNITRKIKNKIKDVRYIAIKKSNEAQIKYFEKRGLILERRKDKHGNDVILIDDKKEKEQNKNMKKGLIGATGVITYALNPLLGILGTAAVGAAANTKKGKKSGKPKAPNTVDNRI